MIQLNKRILIVLIVITSSCSSVDSFRQAYKNFLPSSDESYIVQPGDSIWSIAIKFNVDTDHLIKINFLEDPYVIYPNQKLTISNSKEKNLAFQKINTIKWHHPLGDRSQAAVKDNLWLVFRKPKGTPIHSIHSGKVVVSGPDIPGYGNLVMISHPDGYLSLYAHCEKILVQTGDFVDKGSMIAQLGNSEAAYPMLKFQLRKNGKPLEAEKVRLFF
jgi:LysM repeat protein